MKNEFSSINTKVLDTHELDTVTGGRGGQAVTNAAKWAWRNVGAPIASGAAWEGASRWLGGGSSQPAQPAQPAQPTQPAR